MSTTHTEPSEMLDVAVVGYGPCGQAITAMLGTYGHRVVAFERHPGLYGLPRAGHLDHEIMRILQSLGCAQRVVDETAIPIRKYYWFNGQGVDLMTLNWDAPGISGWDSEWMMWQPRLEDALDGVVRAEPSAEVQQGWEAVAIEHDADGVALTVQRMARSDDGRRLPVDEFRVVRARFLIGADGANGFVRDAVGIEREDYGFNERWLDVDTRPRRPLGEGAGRIGSKDITFGADVFQICDPVRPRFLAPLGRSHRRFEWSLLPGESREEFETPEKAYELLAEWGVTPDDLEIARQAVYTFEAKVATKFRQGPVFLVGDAAHSMPPHMGQGMCTGMRDAKALAWKLDLVLRDVASERLLDTYETERIPNARSWVEQSLAVGKISATLDPEVAAERDAAFARGEAPDVPPVPGLTGGVLDTDTTGGPVGPAGTLSPQGVVQYHGQTALMDDILGHGGFSIVSNSGDPRGVLTADQLSALADFRTTFAHVVPGSGPPATDGAVDIDGVYQTYFGEHAVQAIIIRPDFYVFGAVAKLDELPSAVDRLCELMT
jgi:2-polyprenyl-6-methoxyphenol hydroxylase-like FAD-dependent oxidoreductase